MTTIKERVENIRKQDYVQGSSGIRPVSQEGIILPKK